MWLSCHIGLVNFGAEICNKPPALASFLFLAARAIFLFPTAALFFRQAGVHAGVISFFAELFVDRMFEFQRRRDAKPFVRADKNRRAFGPHKAENQRAFPRVSRDDLADGFKLLRSEEHTSEL